MAAFIHNNTDVVILTLLGSLKDVSVYSVYPPVINGLKSLIGSVSSAMASNIGQAYAANRFIDFTRIAYLEAAINIILSVALAMKYGIVGVAIGTLVSMGYRTIMQIGYLYKHILHKRMTRLFRNMVCFTISTVVIALFSAKLIHMGTLTIGSWILFAFKNLVCAVVVFSATAYILYRSDRKNY